MRFAWCIIIGAAGIVPGQEVDDKNEIKAVVYTLAGHDGHVAIPLPDQAVEEGSLLQGLLPNVQRFITSTATKITNLSNEEKLTAHVRKKVCGDLV